jgi:hypothetical protein
MPNPVLVGLAALLWVAAAPADEARPAINAYPVDLSESLSSGSQVDRIRLHGMLALPAVSIEGMRMSQLSALAWDDDEQLLYALSDKGYLFHLKPQFRDGNLVNVTLQKAVPLTDLKSGKPLKRTDSEGMDILHGRNGRKGDAELLISFERTPRIVRYQPDGKALGELALPAPLSDASAYRSSNRMLEAVCVDSRLGVLTTSEEPLVSDSNILRIFSLSGKSWRYPLTPDFGVTAIECLGEGSVLVLERVFGLTRRAISLKRVQLPEIPTQEVLKATTVVTLDAGLGHRLDNFEGLARHQGKHFFMVSDDNDLFVQRTLLLYFELLD